MQVFLSYADSDLPLVKTVAARLEAAGFETWYDDLYVYPGDNWGKVVGEALETSNAMVALLTHDGLRSKKVDSETSFALRNLGYRGRLIPVIVGREGEITKEEIPWVFNDLNPIFVQNENIEAGIDQILNALNSDIEPRFLARVKVA